MRKLIFTLLGVTALSGCALDLDELAPVIVEVAKTQIPYPASTPQFDPGGYIDERIIEIETFRVAGLEKRITGACYSACTLWLGGNACAERDVVFGFHGPHQSGRRPDPANFDMSSLIIAKYYPERIRDEFWNEWRHLGPRELHLVPAREFIDRGEIREC